METKEKRGRKRLPAGEARTENLLIRLSASERAKIDSNAKQAGLSVSAFIRAKCQ